MSKELNKIKEISGLPFHYDGRMPRMSGSGKKGTLPLYSVYWKDIIEPPKKIEIASTLAGYVKLLNAARRTWEAKVDKKINAGIKKLACAGYTIENPMILTYVYEYTAFFIYKDKLK